MRVEILYFLILEADLREPQGSRQVEVEVELHAGGLVPIALVLELQELVIVEIH